MKIAPRTCTDITPTEDGSHSTEAHSRPLEANWHHSAYVLLGDPGMGKTTAFKTQYQRTTNGFFVTARDFATFDAANMPEWHGKTLFIDGLDEIRAGQTDPRTPLDKIRNNLKVLGEPSFRLSCRSADWRPNDYKDLKSVSPAGSIRVLKLDPLDEASKSLILSDLIEGENVDAFSREAGKRGLSGMLENPQSLVLLTTAVEEDDWPVSLSETLARACGKMVLEHNEEHLNIAPTSEVSAILEDSGRLCSALLMSGLAGFSKVSRYAEKGFPDITETGLSMSRWRNATASKLFKVSESKKPWHVEPVHRRIAEYLAGRYLAKLIEEGIPVKRLLSQFAGSDGLIFAELRSTFAWLAVSSKAARHTLIDLDPFSVAVYGDIATFSLDERKHVFTAALQTSREFEQSLSASEAFGQLITLDLLEAIQSTLIDPPSDAEAPQVVDFLLRAITNAEPLPALKPTLVKLANDDTQRPEIRQSALEALIHYRGEVDCEADLLDLLHATIEGRIADPNDEMLGTLLKVFYPRYIRTEQIWGYYKATNEFFFGTYRLFWQKHILTNANDADIAKLLDSSVRHIAHLESESDRALSACIVALLHRGLHAFDGTLAVDRLYDWLDVAERLQVSSFVLRSEYEGIAKWIESHPELHFDLLFEGTRRHIDDGWYAFYEARKRFLGARLHRGIYWAGVSKAVTLPKTQRNISESLLRVSITDGGLSSSDLREFISDYPEFISYVEDQLQLRSTPSDWEERERESHDRVRRWRQEEQEKIKKIKTFETALIENRAPPSLLFQLANVYFNTFVNVRPESGKNHLSEFLQHDLDLLDASIKGFCGVVDREDVPDIQHILKLLVASKTNMLITPYLARHG